MPDFSPNVRPVVVAPTFNNARTLEAILGALAAMRLAVIIVDDGSTDDTSRILSAVSTERNDEGSTCHVLTHDRNRGKAAALHSGFDRARALGFTHAITIDTDGQHDAADIDQLLQLATMNRTALVVGARPATNGDYPARSFVGRSISNFFVWLESGARVQDSQCGLRVYPLEPLSQILSHARRYGFETEILTRFAWAGLSIAEAPVRCIYDVEGGRTSHFRPFVDSMLAAGMHVKLLMRSTIPWPVKKLVREPITGTLAERFGRWLNPMRTWRAIRTDHGQRRTFAASAALGMGVAVLPPFGLKTIICLLLSRAFKLQPFVVLGVSSLNTPPIGTLLSAMSIITGHLVLHGKWPALAVYNVRTRGVWEVFKSVGIEWAIGSLVLGGFLALLTYTIARLAMRSLPALRHPPTAHQARDETPEPLPSP